MPKHSQEQFAEEFAEKFAGKIPLKFVRPKSKIPPIALCRTNLASETSSLPLENINVNLDHENSSQ